jgi:hypothetical protein
MAFQAASSAQNDAEAIGLMALVFVAGDDIRLRRFLDATGLSPEDLRAAAGETSTITAVLDHLMGDQSLLLVFSAESGLAPETVVRAHAQLSGNHERGEFY